MTAILTAFSTAIAFFNSKLGRVLGVGLIAALIYGAGELRGRRVAGDACRAAAAKAQDAANKQDNTAGADVAKNNDETLDFLQKQKVKADAAIADLQQQLRARPLSAPCLYGPDGKPASGGVRVDGNAGRGADNSSHPRAPLVLAPRNNPAGN